jgi:HsdM N-terminal domain
MKLTQQQLEAHLMGAANILRGRTAGQDYKNYILSLMFYKRLSDQWGHRGRRGDQGAGAPTGAGVYGGGARDLPQARRAPIRDPRRITVGGRESGVAGAKAGEFFTPPEVVDVLVRILEPRPGEAARMTGHSLDVWTRHYAGDYGKPQRDEARPGCSSTASERSSLSPSSRSAATALPPA